MRLLSTTLEDRGCRDMSHHGALIAGDGDWLSMAWVVLCTLAPPSLGRCLIPDAFKGSRLSGWFYGAHVKIRCWVISTACMPNL